MDGLQLDTRSPTVNFGEELKDAFKPVNAWVMNGIAWLDDIQTFYRERAAIEKEYATKLNALAKKYFEKKAKKSSSLSVGDTPDMTPGSLESASLTTWATIITTTESLAKDHDQYSAALTTQVADTLKSISTRYEDFRKRHESLNTKIVTERESVYSDLKKSKSGYDSECKEVEDKRAKVDKSFDSSKAKAERSYRAELTEMSNVKNTYLVQINVANRHKQKYYHEDIPDLLNSLQDLNETRVTKLNSLWSLSCQLDATCRQNSLNHLSNTITEIARNIPSLDSAMFLRHNTSGWNEPNDFSFEPSPLWHDTDDIVTDELATVFLRNLLGKSRRGLEAAKGIVESKQREVQGLQKMRDQLKYDEDSAQKEIDVTRSLLYNQEELVPHSSKLTTLQMEIQTVLEAVGDIERGTQTHKFKPTTFTIPTNCDLCGERAWRLTGKGSTCKDCGYTCHAKCEMKVPAQCPGVLDKAAKKALKASIAAAVPADGIDNGFGLSRSNTMNELSAGYVGGGPQKTGSKLTRTTSLSPAPSASASASASSSSVNTTSTTTSTTTTTATTAAAATAAAATATAAAAAAAAATPRRNRVIAPPPERYISAPPPEPIAELSAEKEPEVMGRMIYAYTATGVGEISVDGNTDVVILESDDGSGWITVRADTQSGLVPASYVDASSPPVTPAGRPSSVHSSSNVSISNSTIGSIGSGGGTVKKRGPAVKPKRGAKKVRHVEAVYEYDARTDVEWSMAEGDRFVLVREDGGDGWMEVEKSGIVKSVPANYVQIVD